MTPTRRRPICRLGGDAIASDGFALPACSVERCSDTCAFGGGVVENVAGVPEAGGFHQQHEQDDHHDGAEQQLDTDVGRASVTAQPSGRAGPGRDRFG